MKRVGKPMFFIVAFLIVLITTLAFTGITTTYGDNTTVVVKGADQIRWGIDIRGGVDVTFSAPEGVDATVEQMNAASEVMKQRLITLNITDYEVYVDTNKDRVIVRFPWKEGEANFDPTAAITELGDTALLTFREGYDVDANGVFTGTTKDTIVLQGKNVNKAEARYGPTKDSGSNEWYVSLELDGDGTKDFGTATERLAKTQGSISIWMDETCISNANVQSAITDGKAIISGNFDQESANSLANKINGGALPFKLITETYSAITPTLGMGARDAMVIAGLISFILVSIYMVMCYRVSGIIAVIALAGQVGFSIACLSGFFPGINSFTLTIPGIAGIILSIGMGVDANVITSERIKEEINAGKSIDGAIEAGYDRGFSAIFDGNITVVIIALILMGSFGAPGTFLSDMLSPFYFMFGPSTEGSIYSFGYTLLIGVIMNFVFGVVASRLMLKSLSRFKPFRNPKLYGGKR